MDLCGRNLVYVVFNSCYVRVVCRRKGMYDDGCVLHREDHRANVHWIPMLPVEGMHCTHWLRSVTSQFYLWDLSSVLKP